MKKITVMLVVFLCFCDTVPSAIAQDSGFPDVTAEWQVAAVNNAVDAGYVDGYSDGTFRPDNNVSRAEFMTMLVKGLEVPKVMNARDHWYDMYLEALKKSFIYRDDDFPADAANDDMTRQEMTNLAYRSVHADLQKETVMMDNKSLVYNAVKEGIVQGLSKGDLALDGNTTRAQAVVIIERLRKLKAGQKLEEVDRHALSLAEINLHDTNSRTMMNFDMVKLPITVDEVDGIKITLEQIIFVDDTDDEDPFAYKIPPSLDESRYPDIGAYKMAIQYHLENPDYETNNHDPYQPSADLLFPNSGWSGASYSTSFDDSAYEMPPGKLFFADEKLTEEQQSGWAFFLANKDRIDKYLKNDGFMNLVINSRNGIHSYQLAMYPKK